jgi:hypothetical protein
MFGLASFIKPINDYELWTTVKLEEKPANGPEVKTKEFDWGMFSVMLPNRYREELLGDLPEIRKRLNDKKLSKIIIELGMFLHVATVFYHGVFFKLDAFFNGETKKKRRK